MTTTQAKSNIAAIKEAVFAEFEALGEAEGTGELARIHAAEKATARGKDGSLDPEDAETAYTRFMTKKAEVTSRIGGSEQAAKQRGSELKHFIVLGANKLLDGVDILDNAVQRMTKIRAGREDGKRGRAWPMLLKFARAQNDSPERALTNQEIDKLFEIAIADDKLATDLLWGARNTINKANEGKEHQSLRDAINLIDEVVAEWGGTTKQKRAAKAAEAKAKKKAKEEADKKKAKLIKRK